MTPGQRRARYLAALRAEIRTSGGQVEEAVLRVLGTLVELRRQIELTLERQASAFDAHRLPELAAELDRQIELWRRRALSEFDAAMEHAWALGGESVLAPLAAVEISIGRTIVPGSLLEELKTFAADRVTAVSRLARERIEREIRLVVLGGQSPTAAMQAIGRTVGQGHLKFIGFRAETIVRTEVAKVQSAARWRRMLDAERSLPGAEKRWVWSRKSRLAHAAANGQRQPVREPFLVGGEEMMHPHDPNASAENTINCGCIAVLEIRHLL